MTPSTPQPLCVGPYVLHRPLGDGACAAVHLATHTATGRVVAIKMLHPEVADIAEMRAALLLEARLLSRIRGRHVVAGVDAGQCGDGSPYAVLELLDGPTVADALESGRLSIAACIAIAEAVLDGLEALHGAGVVHRDVKAANVMLHRDAWGVVPKLIDLGVCLDTRMDVDVLARAAGAAVGTPCYMAPEQIVGGAVDARTDLYGVGGLLYECLTGRVPHEGRDAAELLSRTLDLGAPPVTELRPDCPAALAELVASALALDPRDRPISAREMREQLVAIRESLALPLGADALEALADPPAEPIPLSRPAARAGNGPTRSRRASLAARALAFAAACAITSLSATARDGADPTVATREPVARSKDASAASR